MSLRSFAGNRRPSYESAHLASLTCTNAVADPKSDRGKGKGSEKGKSQGARPLPRFYTAGSPPRACRSGRGTSSTCAARRGGLRVPFPETHFGAWVLGLGKHRLCVDARRLGVTARARSRLDRAAL